MELFQNLNLTLLGLGSFGVGLLSSLHCLGMCGPMVANIGKGFSEIALYHSSRLISYFMVGIFLSLTGKHLLSSLKDYPILAISLSVLIALLALYTFRRKQSLLQKSIFKYVPNKAFALGTISGFLPCGPLYTVLLSASVLTPVQFLTTISLFWLGTLPLLSGSSLILNFIKNKLKLKIPKWAPLVTWSFFAFIAIHRLLAVQAASGGPSCH